MLFTPNNKMALCSAIVSSLPDTKHKLVNETDFQIILKEEKATNRLFSLKNKSTVNMEVSYTKKCNKSFLKMYIIAT